MISSISWGSISHSGQDKDNPLFRSASKRKEKSQIAVVFSMDQIFLDILGICWDYFSNDALQKINCKKLTVMFSSWETDTSCWDWAILDAHMKAKNTFLKKL